MSDKLQFICLTILKQHGDVMSPTDREFILSLTKKLSEGLKIDKIRAKRLVKIYKKAKSVRKPYGIDGTAIENYVRYMERRRAFVFKK